MKKSPTIAHLMMTTALGCAMASGAQAQELLEEIVVTATRSSSTVNRVPMAVSAVSQEVMEAQGIKDVADLARSVPGVEFRQNASEGNPQVTIRGIGGNATSGVGGGQATTGVYLDDINLTKRNVNGLTTGNGSPFPQLFDLERVEVLRGPQGTLYGGSSQGGTIRFITPTPSLTSYSGRARVETSSVKGGGSGYEIGAAFGGPIVEDKIGARGSVFYAKRPGWVDALSQYDGHRFGKDINEGSAIALRGSVLLQINDRLRVTPSMYWSEDYSQDRDNFRMPTEAFVVGRDDPRLRTFNNSGTVNGVRFAFPNVVFPQYTTVAQPWFGPHTTDNGRYLTTSNVQYEKSPRRTTLTAPSVVFDYEFDNMAVKSVTSYINDVTKGTVFQGGGTLRSPRTGVLPRSITRNEQGNVVVHYLPGIPDQWRYYDYNNSRNAISQEFRFNSTNSDARLQWVGGLYFQNSIVKIDGGENTNQTAIAIAMRGAPEAWFQGAYPLPQGWVVGAPLINDSSRRNRVRDTEFAGFGEVTFALTDQLKITGGLRATHLTVDYEQGYGGVVAGAPEGFQGTPNFASTGIVVTNPSNTGAFPMDFAGCPTSPGCPVQYTKAQTTESPVTAKVGVSYQRNADQLFYGTYAEGFRSGGINPPVPAIQCRDSLAALGLTKGQEAYESDTVKSYEVGAKLRLFGGRAQLNSSIYHIKWQNIQFALPLPTCGFSFLSNGPEGISQGFDVQANGRIGPLTLSGSVAYGDAYYSADVRAPTVGGTPGALIVREGDGLGTPDWMVSLGIQYDFTVGRFDGFVRADYQYTGEYQRTTSPGTTSYNAITFEGEPTEMVNARAGLTISENLTVNGFVRNLTNSEEFVRKQNGVFSTLVTGSTFQPRTFGMQLNYRY